MNHSQYLKLMGIEEWRLKTPLTDSLTALSPEPSTKVETKSVNKLASNTVDANAQSGAKTANKVIACPLCLDEANPNHLVVSEQQTHSGQTRRWFWLLEGAFDPLLDGMINATKTKKHPEIKVLNCRTHEGSCTSTLLNQLSEDDVLLILGLRLSRLLLDHHHAFEFESALGVVPASIRQIQGKTSLALPSLQAMQLAQTGRLNKKQAWLTIQQVLQG